MIKDGFLIYDYERNRYRIDWKRVKPWSLISLEIELRQLIEAWPFIEGKLLDVGCGSKPYFLLLAPLVDKYIGVDWPSSTGLNGRVDILATSTGLPFKSDSFDTVLCTEVVEHVPETLQFFKELNRVLRPGGHLILTAPQICWLHREPADFYRFTRYGLKYLAEKSGFDVVYIRPRGGLGAFLVDLAGGVICSLIKSIDKSRYKIYPSVKQPLIASPLIRYLIAIPQRIFLSFYFRFWDKRRDFSNGINDKYTLGHILVAVKR